MTTTTYHKCKVIQSWYGSIERAYISIVTPKGTILTVDKWPHHKLKNKWNENDEVAKLVWRIYEESADTGYVNLTAEEVFLFKDFSDMQDIQLSNKFKNKLK